MTPGRSRLYSSGRIIYECFPKRNFSKTPNWRTVNVKCYKANGLLPSGRNRSLVNCGRALVSQHCHISVKCGWGKHGHVPCKILCSKCLHFVHYCGQKAGLLHLTIGAVPHPGACNLMWGPIGVSGCELGCGI